MSKNKTLGIILLHIIQDGEYLEHYQNYSHHGVAWETKNIIVNDLGTFSLPTLILNLVRYENILMAGIVMFGG